MRARAAARSRSVGRKPGQTSKAIKRSARENGAKGGRPTDRVPDEVLERLGAPPAEPAKLRVWNARFSAEILVLVARGQISAELAGKLRAGATVVIKALPAIVRGDDEDDVDIDDDQERGPELTDVDVDEPMHGG